MQENCICYQFSNFDFVMIPFSYTRFIAFTLMVLGITNCEAAPLAQMTGLSAAQVQRIGHRIWQSECDGSIAGLTSWNAGEEFASLGIGHFIWYPTGASGPFEESFPKLISYLTKRGVVLPQWLKPGMSCPWANKKAFAADAKSPRQQDLRAFLSSTVLEQTEFIMQRLQSAVPGMIQVGGAAVSLSHRLMSQTPEGAFAMIDYVNFKGEGLSPKERYNGIGWGLAQVLGEMQASNASSAPAAFAEAAKRVLARRVANSPSARGENRWLQGWSNRCDGYKRKL